MQISPEYMPALQREMSAHRRRIASTSPHLFARIYLSSAFNVIVVGTVLHHDSLLANLLDGTKCPGWRTFRYQAVERFCDHPELWDRYSTITSGQEPYPAPPAMGGQWGEKGARAFLDDHRERMAEGAKVLWPQQYDYHHLMHVRLREGEAAFQAEFQNQPLDPHETLRGAWNAFAERFMTKVVCGEMPADTIKGPIIDTQFDTDGVTYVKPAPPMGKKSDFFARGRPRKDSTGLKHCPPVARTFPDTTREEWQRVVAHLPAGRWPGDTYEAWMQERAVCAAVGQGVASSLE